MSEINQLEAVNFHFQWLIDRITCLFGLSDVKFAEALIQENVDDINRLFEVIENERNDSKAIILLWRTFFDKLVEETYTVLEEGMNRSMEMTKVLLKCVFLQHQYHLHQRKSVKRKAKESLSDRKALKSMKHHDQIQLQKVCCAISHITKMILFLISLTFFHSI